MMHNHPHTHTHNTPHTITHTLSPWNNSCPPDDLAADSVLSASLCTSVRKRSLSSDTADPDARVPRAVRMRRILGGERE